MAVALLTRPYIIGAPRVGNWRVEDETEAETKFVMSAALDNSNFTQGGACRLFKRNRVSGWWDGVA